MEMTPFKFWHEESQQWLFGGAAQAAYIKSRGGWIEHHDDFAMDVLAARSALEKLNNDAQRTHIKRVK